MRKILALFSKEWRETQIFLWIAWGMFIVIPLIGGLEQIATHMHHPEFIASPWVISLAPIMALVVGVAGTCRDLQPKLEDFWQSRPLRSWTLLVVKFITGAFVILLACDVPLLIEIASHRPGTDAIGGLWFTPLWIASFAVAFAAGCLFRKTAHAAAVAIICLLLLFVIPIVFPPMAWMDLTHVLDNVTAHSRGFTGVASLGKLGEGLLGVAAVSLGIGVAAVKRGWHVDSGAPLIACTVGAAFVILIGSASYQLGTNLPIISKVDVAEGTNVEMLETAGASTTALLFRQPRNNAMNVDETYYKQEFNVEANSIKLGTMTPARWPDQPISYSVLCPSDHSILYQLVQDEKSRQLFMWIERNDGYDFRPTAGQFKLWQSPAKLETGYITASDSKLYIVGARSIVFDISDALHPRKIFDEPIRWQPFTQVVGDREIFHLPPAPGLSPQDRLKFALNPYGNFPPCFDGKVLCKGQLSIASSVLVSLTDDRAEFNFIGQYQPRLLQWLAGTYGYQTLTMRNGLLYAQQRSIVSVFSVPSDRPPQLIAHFAQPGLRCFELMPDGRAIAGGDGLWLLGPPPRHG